MLTNTDSSPKQSSTFVKTLQGKLKDIKNFSNWSEKEQMVAVSVAGTIFGAAFPFLVILFPAAATGAVVALTLFFAFEAVKYTFKGLKWSAEKTVEGARYTAGKIRDSYEYSVDSLKKGADFVSEKAKEKTSGILSTAANKLYRAAGKENYLDKIKRFTPEELKKIDEIRNDMKEIFADKGNNSGLVEDILSEISSKIDSKMAEEAKSGCVEYASKWKIQKKFVNNLNKKSLHSLLTQRSLPDGSYFIDSIFSEHYDEIKEVIAKCKENHALKGELKMRCNMFGAGDTKSSRSLFSPQSSESSLSGSGSSLNCNSTDSSTAGLLGTEENKEVKTTTSLWNKSLSLFKVGKKSEKTSEVKYQTFESDTVPPATVNPNHLRGSNLYSSLSSGSSQLKEIAPPQVTKSLSFDSAVGLSSPSTPNEQDPILKELDRGLDEALNNLEHEIPQLLSSVITEPGATQTTVRIIE
ncbi:actin-bundling T4SS effector WalE1 family protein [Wolbachia pipientis]|uniref:actin-bundling T4SS effector WalE1 family protein n=1 Tax=Wolbachia pipientis TaxID=955 RepID=UPI0025A337DB|nr:hypothetical protein [Wolbachia pipientis]MDM8335089.1 hypothetical protein [Wolbachia pipientis]